MFEALFQYYNDVVQMRDMAHSICPIKLYQITMRKNFRFFVSDYLNVSFIQEDNVFSRFHLEDRKAPSVHIYCRDVMSFKFPNCRRTRCKPSSPVEFEVENVTPAAINMIKSHSPIL